MARYFKDSEIKGLDPKLVKALDEAREYAGIPFVITSGKRTSETNERALGVENSAHLTGLAVDLRADNSLDRYQMVRGLLLAGFKRIGVYSGHIHADLDYGKPYPVMWLGGLSHA